MAIIRALRSRRWTPSRLRQHPEAGITLIEMMVAVSIAMILVAGITTLIIDALRVETRIRTLAEASNLAQLINTDLDRGLQNATAIRLQNGFAPRDQLLRARTATVRIVSSGGAGVVEYNWYCRAWYYSAAQAKLYTHVSEPNTSAIVSAPLSSADLGQWRQLGTDVRPLPDAAVFVSADGTVLEAALDVEVGATQLPVRLEATYDTSRVDVDDLQLLREPTTCW